MSKNTLLEKATHTLRDHTVIELCLADQEQLAAHVLNPPEDGGLPDLETFIQGWAIYE